MTLTLDELAGRATDSTPLSAAELAAVIAALGTRWSSDGDKLRMHVAAKGMARTGALAAHIGALADEMQHHPDLELRYAGLTLAVNTHDAGNQITMLDAVLAARIEQWARAQLPLE